RGGISTAFVTNTYPIHATVSTGKPPRDHGIISNLLPPDKNGERLWAQTADLIKTKTLWEAARARGLSTAAFLWPTTGGAKIDWHIPEAHASKGKNLFALSLKNGSALFQISALLRHGGKLARSFSKKLSAAERAAALDDFTTSAACDLFNRRKPDLALVHLVAYDSLFHAFGSCGPEIEAAKKSLEQNLGRLVESWGERGPVIVFSDHSQLDIRQCVDLEARYGEAIFEQVGGSAFLREAIPGIEAEPWLERFLTKAEMEESGYADLAPFGIAAKPGFLFSDDDRYRGGHGYPADYENYNVFYCAKGLSFSDSENHSLKNRLTDVTAIVARELDLEMDVLEEYGFKEKTNRS
ncbi:MAG: alkaline phosphatase family protein, partial [Treponema sp.]|nr:alkaline phosphatase family protein [Treponema sp.]